MRLMIMLKYMSITFLAVVVAFLDETTEGCESCAWSDHDHRGLELEGKSELCAAHEYWYSRLQIVRWYLVVEEVGAYAVAGAPVFGFVLNDCACNVDRIRVELRIRREIRRVFES